jgi:undecaprenyl-diphosphatase
MNRLPDRPRRLISPLAGYLQPWASSLVAYIPRRIGWGQFITLAALCVCAGGLYGFIVIVDEVGEGEAHGFDSAILLALRSPNDLHDPIGPAWLEIMFRDITALGSYTIVVVVGVLALGYLAVLRHWASALLILISLLGGWLLKSALKQTFERPRPELVAHLVEVQSGSFPSGHAMLSAVMFLTLGAVLAQAQSGRRLKAYVLGCAVALTLIVGASRVYLGVHWPTDILAGWSIGASWAMACWLVAHFLRRRGHQGGWDSDT